MLEPIDKLNLVLDTVTDGILVVDKRGYVLYANRSAEALIDRGSLVGMMLAIPLNSDNTPRDINLVQRGSIGWAELRTAPLVWDGQPAYVMGLRDITERKLSEDRIRQAAAVFESTHEGVMLTDTELKILMVNRAFCEITDYQEDEVVGQAPSILSSGQHDKAFYQRMWELIKSTGHWQGEIWNRRKTGEVYPELLSISAVRNSTGEIVNYVGVFADISKLKATESRLKFLAHHDPLTGLPNRLLLLSRIEHAMKIAQRDHNKMAVLMIDLDRFKDVNDSFGHLAGDELLKLVADRLKLRLRGIDTICRLGGDEFTVLLEDISHPEDAAVVANDVIDALGQVWHLSTGSELRIGASVGISLYPEHGDNSEALLQHADTALYKAKSDGRGLFKYFSEDLTLLARGRIEIEVGLRQALENEEFRVYYQPQVDIPSGHIIGAEALVRWQHPKRGLVSPIEFIRVAEETGLIAPIGDWVLREACRQGQCWNKAGLPPLSLAVNVSPQQFLYNDIGETVSAILAETSFPAEQLELELTEGIFMEREEEAIGILQRLRGLGLKIAIDDFGTGYSSLSYLRKFPLDTLKIDKSFVDNIPDDIEDVAITTTIIAMASNLHLNVLAEGVENDAQLAFLQDRGCDSYQGYLTSQPVPAATFEKLLRDQA